MIDKLINRLDRDNITDYEVVSRIPNDVISIYPDSSSVNIFLPEDYEYSQYEIDDFIRSMAPHLRTSITSKNNIYNMKVSGPLTEIQIYKLIKFIIESSDFCAILDNN